MNRRAFLKQVGLGAAALTVCHTANAKRHDKPNIIILFTDDLDFDEINIYDPVAFATATGARARGILPEKRLWSAYHKPRMLTPHIDSLARDGAMFTRFYITSPVCTPSRYSLLTGRYASRSTEFRKEFPDGTPADIMWNTHLGDDEWNIAKGLKSAGYATGLVGKWHLFEWHHPAVGRNEGIAKDADPRDPAIAKQLRETYDRSRNYIMAHDGFDEVARLYANNKEALGLPDVLDTHNLEWLTEGAVDFIDRHKDEPFFLYFSYPVPHGTYGGPNSANGDPLATPMGMLDKVPETDMPSRESIRQRLKDNDIDPRNEMATWLDDSIGAVLKRLDDHGIADNTIIWFISDHQNRGKYTVYEAGRVPTLMRWPARISPGVLCDELCANIDVAPTLMDSGSAKIPKDTIVDGASILPLVTSEKSSGKWRDTLLLQMAYARAAVTKHYKYIALRYPPDLYNEMLANGEERYTWDGSRYKDKQTGEEGVWYDSNLYFPHYHEHDQLYDLITDPYEQNNLYELPDYQSVVKDMQSRLRALLQPLPHTFGEFKTS